MIGRVCMYMCVCVHACVFASVCVCMFTLGPRFEQLGKELQEI